MGLEEAVKLVEIPMTAFEIMMDKKTSPQMNLVMAQALASEVQFESFMAGFAQALTFAQRHPELALKMLDDIERTQVRGMGEQFLMQKRTHCDWIAIQNQFDVTKEMQFDVAKDGGEGAQH